MYINDGNLKFHYPQFEMINIQDIDVVCITNYHNMLALPYLTEYLGFNGRIYATEPTMNIGKFDVLFLLF